jgi:hypothetical protein
MSISGNWAIEKMGRSELSSEPCLQLLYHHRIYQDVAAVSCVVEHNDLPVSGITDADCSEVGPRESTRRGPRAVVDLGPSAVVGRSEHLHVADVRAGTVVIGIGVDVLTAAAEALPEVKRR